MAEKRTQKLFSPTIMFNHHVKSCWSTNVRTVEGGLPIHEALAAAGQYAIFVEPGQEKEWYAVGLPLRKDWLPFDASRMAAARLSFSALCEGPVTVRVELRGAADESHVASEALRLESTEDFARCSVPLAGCPFLASLKMVLVTGASSSQRWLLRDVVVEEA